MYWTTNVITCVSAVATAGFQLVAPGTNCTINIVTAPARTPALTFAVGAQLVFFCSPIAIPVAAILHLQKNSMSHLISGVRAPAPIIDNWKSEGPFGEKRG
jgi:hypothetical protein